MRIPFVKLHGLGNTWIVVDWLDVVKARPGARLGPRRAAADRTVAADVSTLARALCDPRQGVGADGLIVVTPPRDRRHDARVLFSNADGSPAEMSGNGIRCAAAFLLRSRQRRRRNLAIETAAGVKTITTLEAGTRRWTFRVNMGEPILEPARIPFTGAGARVPVVGFPLKIRQGEFKVTVTSMGNPHCTVFVHDFESLDWRAMGREMEKHPRFPNRANVEFVKILSRQELAARFWERGVGETKSSGTGSCAAVVAAVLNGLTGLRVSVHAPAGRLEVAWRKGGEVTLVGPVVFVKRGLYARVVP